MEFRKWATLAEAQTGKSITVQLREITKLNKTGGQCGVTDYYQFKLYDDSYLKGRGREDFLGWRLEEEFSRSLNPRYAVLPAWDKMTFAVTAYASGLPVAPTVACFHPANNISEIFGAHLKTVDEVREYLRTPSVYPLFGKPAFSQGGHGALHLAGINDGLDQLVLLDGKTIPLDKFLYRLTEAVDQRFHKPLCGYLFQKPLRQANEVLALTNWPAICSVRIVCLNHLGYVTPIRAVLKMAVPPNHTDNFSHGGSGNIAANIDLATGEIGIALDRLWPGAEIYSAFPGAGASLNGFMVPGWDELLSICDRAGRVYPLMKIHHWDFAITNDGPKIMELNDIGGSWVVQMHGHGLLTSDTREFLKTHVDKKTHSWVTRL